ncbi:DUF3038 domain-containing protein [Aerosakkonemataceae cyanobacterium BLCC-F154]|uniref:DUF3038 domain-containing protein n=1 Tax=Floridaenema fluviatile BLCC-F154 TaxID=3153640 RepID=A0ABV4YL30_9CYAN
MQLQRLSPTLVSEREELTLTSSLDPVQLSNMKSQLDETFLALEALAGVDEQAILTAASQLNMPSAEERMDIWQRNQPENERLNLEDLRSLTLIINHLAKQHQELIRRAVALLEQLTEEQRELQTSSLLNDYINTFSKLYSEGMKHQTILSKEALTQLALKKIMDLLFYSTSSGHQRLWFSLLEKTHPEPQQNLYP